MLKIYDDVPGRWLPNLNPMAMFIASLLFVMTDVTSALAIFPAPQTKPSELEISVRQIFSQNCTTAGCHSGTYPQMGLKLTEDAYRETTVNIASTEKPLLMRVKPGSPDSSYLVMKILGEEGITGLRMPFGRNPLSQEDIATIIEWIKSLKPLKTGSLPVQKSVPLLPFSGWKVVDIPTTRMVDSGQWLFLIGHRFFPKINDGYDAFYGLDGPANIFLNMGYAFTNDFFVNLGHSNVSSDVELDLKYGIKRQYQSDRLPIAAAVQASVDWASQKSPGKKRWRPEAFSYSGQLVLESQLHPGIAVVAVPGILFNPDNQQEGEDPLVSVGLGGKVHVYKTLSVIAEWDPIITGYVLTTTRSEYNRFDTWGGGLEIFLAGHVFQIIVSNSVGLTTAQYMRGGDLDLRDGDMRLGFNIFRILQF